MAYLLIEEDIRDLAASDDYRGCLDLKLEELKSFVLPSWLHSQITDQRQESGFQRDPAGGGGGGEYTWTVPLTL